MFAGERHLAVWVHGLRRVHHLASPPRDPGARFHEPLRGLINQVKLRRGAFKRQNGSPRLDPVAILHVFRRFETHPAAELRGDRNTRHHARHLRSPNHHTRLILDPEKRGGFVAVRRVLTDQVIQIRIRKVDHQKFPLQFLKPSG